MGGTKEIATCHGGWGLETIYQLSLWKSKVPSREIINQNLIISSLEMLSLSQISNLRVLSIVHYLAFTYIQIKAIMMMNEAKYEFKECFM